MKIIITIYAWYIPARHSLSSQSERRTWCLSSNKLLLPRTFSSNSLFHSITLFLPITTRSIVQFYTLVWARNEEFRLLLCFCRLQPDPIHRSILHTSLSEEWSISSITLFLPITTRSYIHRSILHTSLSEEWYIGSRKVWGISSAIYLSQNWHLHASSLTVSSFNSLSHWW